MTGGECQAMWETLASGECPLRSWGHLCTLDTGHDEPHLCACKQSVACVCMCHDPEPKMTSHVRPCCIDWVGGFWGKVGEAYPLIEARVRREERERILGILERVVAGRTEYEERTPEGHWSKETHRTEVAMVQSVICVVRGDRFAVQNLLPSWRLTDEEAAEIYADSGD